MIKLKNIGLSQILKHYIQSRTHYLPEPKRAYLNRLDSFSPLYSSIAHAYGLPGKFWGTSGSGHCATKTPSRKKEKNREKIIPWKCETPQKSKTHHCLADPGTSPPAAPLRGLGHLLHRSLPVATDEAIPTIPWLRTGRGRAGRGRSGPGSTSALPVSAPLPFPPASLLAAPFSTPCAVAVD